MPRLETRNYRVSSLTQASDIPHLSLDKQPHQSKSDIDNFEGLFIDYGWRETTYPYTQQNAYAEETEQEITVAVLENEYLYAEFLPTLGGRLWKLYDKKKQKDVLYTNDVIRFSNLSIRNAWFSGGVEWNCGIIGHSPFTCSQMYCAFVKGKNGEDVLRFYEFERVREIYYQIDFWLDANKLMTAVRIENQNTEVVPMYWWSNMATPEYKGGRVVVPADSAYNNSDGMGIKKHQYLLITALMFLIPRIYRIQSTTFMIFLRTKQSSLPMLIRTDMGFCSFQAIVLRAESCFPRVTKRAHITGRICLRIKQGTMLKFRQVSAKHSMSVFQCRRNVYGAFPNAIHLLIFLRIK